MTFTGKNLQSYPYIKFNNQIRRLILTTGEDGEELLKHLNDIEKLGNEKFTNEDLHNFAKEVPKALEYDRVVKAALLNWISGIAQGLVEHGTECGFDAWRKLYHRYIPLADDMQNI